MLGEWVFVLMCWLYMATLLRLLLVEEMVGNECEDRHYAVMLRTQRIVSMETL